MNLDLNLVPVTLNLETAIPCGLLINELVTNAFKHAFVEGRPGKISLILTLESNQLHLKIQDDGIGFAPGIDWQNSPTLGLRLARLLAYQLDAKLTKVVVETGSCFHLTFSGAPHPFYYLVKPIRLKDLVHTLHTAITDARSELNRDTTLVLSSVPERRQSSTPSPPGMLEHPDTSAPPGNRAAYENLDVICQDEICQDEEREVNSEPKSQGVNPALNPG